MHIPDGFIDAATSAGAGAVTVAGLGVAAKRAAVELDDRAAPLAGLTAAFIFAVQMLNFPVAAGTSGHLIGGVLAAVLVGPWAAAICLAVVLVVQALFADGGLSALGLNILNMGLVGGMGGYLVFATVRAVLPKTRAGVLAATAVAAWSSVVLASAAFALEYAIGGTVDLSLRQVIGAMVGVHALIGIGEAVGLAAGERAHEDREGDGDRQAGEHEDRGALHDASSAGRSSRVAARWRAP
ncbi:MAG TPA: energy-coupling factor ABC transporter permease [Acidimicrobiales bacterium]|nr:energy-coupling factor ABC transporter permease [Acidimicrobiales bacterium]